MREILRKLIHLFFGIALAAIVLFLGRENAIWIFSTGLFFGVVLIEVLHRGYLVPVVSWVVDYCDRGEVMPWRGALYYVVSALFCVIIFPAQVAVSALITVAVLDSTTAIIGSRFGKRRIWNGKSLEGTLAGIVLTGAVLLPFLPVPIALIAAIVAGIVELLSPVDDNLLIPPITGILIILLLPFF